MIIISRHASVSTSASSAIRYQIRDELNYGSRTQLVSKRVSNRGMCKGFDSIDCRNPAEINSVLESHEWVSMSSDRTPIGIISRFTCTRCGDEYVVMLTSPSAMDSIGEFTSSEIQVTAGSVTMS